MEHKRYSINKARTSIVVYSLKLAGWLMFHGSVIGGISEDSNGSGKKVFYFKNTEHNQELIDRYYNVIEK